jgi:hypothetical protein
MRMIFFVNEDLEGVNTIFDCEVGVDNPNPEFQKFDLFLHNARSEATIEFPSIPDRHSQKPTFGAFISMSTDFHKSFSNTYRGISSSSIILAWVSKLRSPAEWHLPLSSCDFLYFAIQLNSFGAFYTMIERQSHMMLFWTQIHFLRIFQNHHILIPIFLGFQEFRVFSSQTVQRRSMNGSALVLYCITSPSRISRFANHVSNDSVSNFFDRLFSFRSLSNRLSFEFISMPWLSCNR